MAIANREKDVSEQKMDVQVALKNVVTGVTSVIFVAPYPCTLVSASGFALAVSGAMNLAFLRITANGQSVIAASISGMICGNSGMFGYSGLAAAGSTLLSLGAKDAIAISSSGANTAAGDLHLHLVIQKTQDIVSYV